MILKLSISRGYVATWTFADAMRELLQNAIDGGDLSYVTEYDGFGRYKITIANSGSMEVDKLLLGTSTKAGDEDKIGQFGEGFKLAALVIVRAGYRMQIFTGGKVWTPFLTIDENFGVEVLAFEVEDEFEKADSEDMTVVKLYDIPEHEKNSAAMMYLPTSTLKDSERVNTPRGEVLIDGKGAIFVNNLFICQQEQFAHGYNFKPRMLTLERDRKTVSDWELRYNTSRACYGAFTPEQVAQMIFDEVPDVAYADVNATSEIKEAVYDLFESKYGKSATTGSAGVTYGGGIVGMLPRMIGKMVAENPRHALALRLTRQSAAPADVLANWLSDNRKQMRKGAIVAFKQLIEDAKQWKN